MARYNLVKGQYEKAEAALKDGWSIHIALKRAGIVPAQYKYLMATNKRFYDMIRQYVEYLPRAKEVPVVQASKFVGEMATLLPRGRDAKN